MAAKAKSTLWFTVFWVGWALSGIVVELVALARKDKQDTLSEHVWAYLTGHRHPATMPRSAAWAGRVVILGFFAWLGPHFAFKIWGG